MEQITHSILILRSYKVLLDTDRAALYGVPTKRSNEQVKRNSARFPEDFLFRLTSAEVEALNSRRAVEMSVYVVCAFVELRELLVLDKSLAKRLEELEGRIIKQFGTYDQLITGILNTLRELTNQPAPKKRGIGFTCRSR